LCIVANSRDWRLCEIMRKLSSSRLVIAIKTEVRGHESLERIHKIKTRLQKSSKTQDNLKCWAFAHSNALRNDCSALSIISDLSIWRFRRMSSFGEGGRLHCKTAGPFTPNSDHETGLRCSANFCQIFLSCSSLRQRRGCTPLPSLSERSGLHGIRASVTARSQRQIFDC